jgi:hypothetical protein
VVRALGPTLTGFGVAGALQDPTLHLVNSSGVTIATNNNWKDAVTCVLLRGAKKDCREIVAASICAILGPWRRHPKKMGSASAIRTRSHPDHLRARSAAASHFSFTAPTPPPGAPGFGLVVQSSRRRDLHRFASQPSMRGSGCAFDCACRAA